MIVRAMVGALVCACYWSCAASPAAPSPVNVAGTYRFTVTSSSSCHVSDRPTAISASESVTLLQSGSIVTAHVDTVDAVFQTDFVDIAGMVSGTTLSMTLAIRVYGKFQSFNLSGSAVGTIQGQVITGTVSGPFQYLNADLGRPDLLNCTAPDHAFTMAPPPP